MSEGGTIRIAYEDQGTCRLASWRVAAGAFWLEETLEFSVIEKIGVYIPRCAISCGDSSGSV